MNQTMAPEDDITASYIEGREVVERSESPAVLALQKYSTPEEFQALIPQLGFQPSAPGRPFPAGSSVVGGEGLYVGTPDDIRSGKTPEGGGVAQSRDAMRPGVVMGYDISRYATDPTHEKKVGAFAGQMVHLDNASAIDQHIQSIAPGSPITGQMVMEASKQHEVSPAMILALMRQDSAYGTRGLAVKTQNPGNVGNDDAGNTRTYPTWGAGVDAVAQWLSRNRDGTQPLTTKMPPPLEMLAMGMSRDDIEAEMQGLQVASAFADPINLVVDVGTGLLSSAGREAAGIITSGAVKAGSKLLGKEVGEQVTYGALGSAFLNAAEGAGLGPIMQDLTGIIGPVATGALLQLPRSGLAQYLKQLEAGNPEVFDKLKAKFSEFKESPAWQTIERGGSVKDSIKDIALAILKSEEGNIPFGPTVKQKISELSGPKPLEQDATALKRMPEAERQIEKAVLRDDLPLPKSKYISTNINHTKLETSDDIIKLIDQVGKSIEPEIDAARREKISLEQTQRMANDLGWSVETLLKRNRGQAFNAEQVTASRMIMMDSADSVIDLAKRVRAGDNSDETMVALRGAISRHAAIQAQVSGMAAEAGRALNAFNIMAKAGQFQGLKQALEQGGGRYNIEAMADAIASVAEAQTTAGVKPTLSGINAVTKKLDRATTWDMIMEGWIMGLLSGPQTHAANVLSNALTATWMVPERKLASWISQSPVGSGEIMSGEATALAYGLVNGFTDGLVMAARALRSGKGSTTLGAKIEGHRAAITAENIRQLPLAQKLPTNILSGGWMARAVDLLGETVRTPGRFLTSEDELFKAIGYRMEVQAQAFRQASSEGLEGNALSNRITELVNNPPDNIKLAGINAANYQTFTGETGPLANAVKTMVYNVPILRVIVPFINTPANIARFSLERTPLAPMFKSVRADLASGGARRDLALARISLGSMVMASVAAWSAAGVITGGGPSDKDMKEILKRKGWQPYSIKIGNNYVSYNRMDPIGMVMGMAADSAEIMGQVGKIDASRLAGATIIAISQNLLSKTYTRGLADAFDVISSAQKYENANRGRDYLVKMAQSIVPAGLAQVNRTLIDNQLRNVRQYQGWQFFKNSLCSRIPGYSDDLPPQRNLWGEPIVLEGGIGPDIMSPIYTNSEKISPIDDELLRLKLPIRMPRPYIGGVELSAREYDRFLQLSGNEAKNPANGLGMKDALSKLITEPYYRKQSDNADDLKGGKALLIESTVRAYRELAKAKLLQEFQDLADLIRERAGMEAKALQPAY